MNASCAKKNILSVKKSVTEKSHYTTTPELASFPGLLTPAFVACSTTNALVLQATNAGVRRPGNKAIQSPTVHCMMCSVTVVSNYLGQLPVRL